MSVRPTTNLSSTPDLRQLQDEWRGLGRDVEKFDTESAQRFVDVADSLGTPQEDRWSRTGVLEHLGLESIERHAAVAYQGRDKWLFILRLFEWGRNFLILGPVLITWIGLHDAAANYEAAVAASS